MARGCSRAAASRRSPTTRAATASPIPHRRTAGTPTTSWRRTSGDDRRAGWGRGGWCWRATRWARTRSRPTPCATRSGSRPGRSAPSSRRCRARSARLLGRLADGLERGGVEASSRPRPRSRPRLARDAAADHAGPASAAIATRGGRTGAARGPALAPFRRPRRARVPRPPVARRRQPRRGRPRPPLRGRRGLGRAAAARVADQRGGGRVALAWQGGGCHARSPPSAKARGRRASGGSDSR